MHDNFHKYYVTIITKPTLEFMMNSHLVALQKSILASWDALKVWFVMVQAFRKNTNVQTCIFCTMFGNVFKISVIV